MTMLFEMFPAQIGELLFGLDEVDCDLFFLHEILKHENVSEGDALHPWAKGPVSRHMQR